MKQSKKRRRHSQTKQGNGLESTKTNMETQSSVLENKQSSTLASALSAQTMTYGMFLKILLKELPEPDNWQEIVVDYVDAIRTDKSNNILDCQKKILYNEWKHDLVSWCCFVLKHQWKEEVAQAICDQGYSFITYMEDRDMYLKQIYAVETEIKVLIILVNQYVAEYKMLTQQEAEDGKPTRTWIDYENEVAVLSRFQGYRIDIWKTTVIQWCAIVNSYVQDVNAKKKHYGAR